MTMLNNYNLLSLIQIALFLYCDISAMTILGTNVSNQIARAVAANLWEEEWGQTVGNFCGHSTQRHLSRGCRR